jgi:seryl-tRNA synthetase
VAVDAGLASFHMIDLKVLREDPDRVRNSQRDRRADPAVVDALLAADSAHRAATVRFDTLRNEQKNLGKEIAQAKGDEKAAKLARGSELSAQVKAAEVEQTELAAEVRRLHLQIENLLEAGAPLGGEDDFAVVEVVGTPPTFDFPVRDHLELGELLGAIDTRCQGQWRSVLLPHGSWGDARVCTDAARSAERRPQRLRSDDHTGAGEA